MIRNHGKVNKINLGKASLDSFSNAAEITKALF